MNTDAKVKYAAVGLLLTSIFGLVIHGDVEAGLYVTLVTNLLVGLGIYHAAGSSDPTPPAIDFPVTGKAS